MSYISIEFFILLAATVVCYYILPLRARPAVLLLASCVFYYFSGIGNFIYLVLFIAFTFVFSRFAKKKAFAVIYAVISAGSLIFLKFAGFVANALHSPVTFDGIIVPLGLSFFTLQGISYIFDLKKGKTEAGGNFLTVALYLSYFPIIVQGPVSRFSQLAPQLEKGHRFDYDSFRGGFQLALWGTFKKLVIANRAALIADEIFGNYYNYEGIVIVFGALVYALQLYADFSGCVDFCRGISEIFGIKLMNNFNRPYTSLSVKEFWNRWHISLSSWLKDYIYIPLGGNRKGKLRKYINLMITFLVSGLWHGVGFRYLFWGGLHGAYQIAGDITAKPKKNLLEKLRIDPLCPTMVTIRRIVSLCLVSYAWIWFRAVSARAAAHMTLSLFTKNFFCIKTVFGIIFQSNNIYVLFFAFVLFVIVSALQGKYNIRQEISKFSLPVRWLIYFTAIYVVVIFGEYGGGYSASEFLYMQF